MPQSKEHDTNNQEEEPKVPPRNVDVLLREVVTADFHMPTRLSGDTNSQENSREDKKS